LTELASASLPILTTEQRQAAEAGPHGAFLVAAGPGTGKTFTMVERFCWLVSSQAVAPTEILAVTFTEAAAAELRERIAAELIARGRREDAATLDASWIVTFHGACARLLRENAYLVGLPRELRVLDELDQRLVLERLQAKLRAGGGGPELDPDSFTALNPDEVSDLVKSGLDFALKLKGRGISPDRFRELAARIHGEHPHALASAPSALAEAEAIRALYAVYATYEAWLRDEGRIDFDDLILTTIRALEENPEFRARAHRTFRHVIVDEFQDTNRIQLDLVRWLAAPDYANVVAVGDAKQSIYGWRDADIENIRTRFPGVRLPLTRNRRSVQQVLDLATDFIRRDPDFESEPELIAERGAGPGLPVTLAMATDSRQEARMVAGEIRRLAARGVPYAQIAILSHSVRRLPREFEEELRTQGVPYVTSAGTGFFDREEVKDVLALMRLVADPMDDGALVRVLQGPVVRLDDRGMYRLAARRFGAPGERSLRGMRLRDCLEASRAEGFPEFEPEVAARALRVIHAVDDLGLQRDALTVADVLNRLLEVTGYLRHSQLRAAREGPRGLLNLRKVFRMANRFERDRPLAGLHDFVDHLDQIIDADLPVSEAEVEAADAVRLLTIHGAKGLEFQAVFVVNLRPPNVRDTERLFFDPDSFGFVMKWWRNDRHPRFKELAPGGAALRLARQERRRMVYVALTRARDLLYVSASRAEESPELVEVGTDDHFAELLAWARNHAEAARVVEAEQLALPGAEPPPVVDTDGPRAVATAIDRLRLLRATPSAAAGPPPRDALVHLSFSDLHQFELCPVRYRYASVWRVPAPPDELQTKAVRGISSSELGRAVHEALAAFHADGVDLAAHYVGPDAGRELLVRYLAHPLAQAPTLGCEVEFNLRLDGVRVRGLVDRVCEWEGGTALVDYKTNARLDAALLEAYSTQLRLYGLAAREGLLPGGPDPRLLLFDLRHGELIEVAPDPERVRREVEEAAARIAAGDFALGPEHAQRPCQLCAYRPVCPDARA
jgi:DNA helicase-2/ATP-dependent DNA helicase PcrA